MAALNWDALHPQAGQNYNQAGMMGAQQALNPATSAPWMPWNYQPPPAFMMNQVNASNQAMPGFLQIDQNWGAPEQKIATDEYMSTQVNPAMAQQRSLDLAAGSAQSTFSAGRNAAIQTMGARQAMLAGLDAKNAAVNQKLAERQSYLNVPTAGLNPSQGYGPDLANRLYGQAYNQAQQQQYGKTSGAFGLASGIAGGLGYIGKALGY